MLDLGGIVEIFRVISSYSTQSLVHVYFGTAFAGETNFLGARCWVGEIVRAGGRAVNSNEEEMLGVQDLNLLFKELFCFQ